MLASSNGFTSSEYYKDFGNYQIYYEIKIESIESEQNDKKKFRVYVKDISKIIIMQQKTCDEMYRDSVLSNYSHEQLTPLNSFLNNSKMLL